MVASLVGVGLALLAAVALAGQSLSVRLSTKTHSVADVIATVFLVNVVVLVPVTVARHYPAFGLTPTAIGAFAIAGLLGSLLARFCLFIGIERLGASRAEPLKSLFPLVAVAAAVIALREQLTLALLAGIVLLVGGAILVSWETRANPGIATGRGLWVDVSFPLAAALFLGIDPIFMKVGLAAGTPALVSVTTRVLAAAAGFVLYLLWRRLRAGQLRLASPNRWLLVASVANTVYLVTYIAALVRAPVSVVAPILGASPLLVVLGAAAFIQREEQVTLRLGLAVLVIVAGVVLVLGG